MKQNVMIVDDDPGVLRSATFVLAAHGYQITRAPSGEECLQALRQGFKGVILMDIMMPGLSGWDTVRAMQAENLLGKDQLVCMLTARQNPDGGCEGLQECIFDYLAKPFDNEQLIALVDNANAILTP